MSDYRIRDPFPSEDAYFKSNPTVAGMATEDGKIILNPYSGLSPTEQEGVIKNEGARLDMRAMDLPDFQITDEQRDQFVGTPYADNSQAMRETILGRIISGDPSVGAFTPEQKRIADTVKKKPIMDGAERSRILNALRDYESQDPLQAWLDRWQQDFATAGTADTWPSLPYRSVTPGEARTDMTEEEIAAKKWGQDSRAAVTSKIKQGAFDDYGLTGNKDPYYPPDEHKRRYQIDHLIPRELGGADTPENLWPAPYNPNRLPDTGWADIHPEDMRQQEPWNGYDVVRKDITANRLKKEVAEGRLSLEDAQKMISGDWRRAFDQYYGKPDVNKSY